MFYLVSSVRLFLRWLCLRYLCPYCSRSDFYEHFFWLLNLLTFLHTHIKGHKPTIMGCLKVMRETSTLRALLSQSRPNNGVSKKPFRIMWFYGMYYSAGQKFCTLILWIFFDTTGWWSSVNRATLKLTLFIWKSTSNIYPSLSGRLEKNFDLNVQNFWSALYNNYSLVDDYQKGC